MRVDALRFLHLIDALFRQLQPEARLGGDAPCQLQRYLGQLAVGHHAIYESAGVQIYVTTFPGAAGKWQVSRGGGVEPRWRGDSKEIFYIGAKSTFTAVPVSTGGNVFAREPRNAASRASFAPRFLPQIFSAMT